MRAEWDMWGTRMAWRIGKHRQGRRADGTGDRGIKLTTSLCR